MILEGRDTVITKSLPFACVQNLQLTNTRKSSPHSVYSRQLYRGGRDKKFYFRKWFKKSETMVL